MYYYLKIGYYYVICLGLEIYGLIENGWVEEPPFSLDHKRLLSLVCETNQLKFIILGESISAIYTFHYEPKSMIFSLDILRIKLISHGNVSTYLFYTLILYEHKNFLADTENLATKMITKF